MLQARIRDAQLRRVQAARGVGVRHVQHYRRRCGESNLIESLEIIQQHVAATLHCQQVAATPVKNDFSRNFLPYAILLYNLCACNTTYALVAFSPPPLCVLLQLKLISRINQQGAGEATCVVSRETIHDNHNNAVRVQYRSEKWPNANDSALNEHTCVLVLSHKASSLRNPLDLLDRC